ncbi:MAG: sigma-54-dependent Fis family transcriptional regulator [Myxococcaceae bacterium]|nr:sigma-54-dependent Fis family transcriptional regulator [Myxococcaceae bacterium]
MAKVLVVEDEPNLRKVLGALLRREGYEVTIAENGEMGLAEFDKNGADVVITDLVMPKVGGMEVLRGINERTPDVPVIIVTAHGTVDSAVEAIKLGAFDYITKPFDQAELQAVIAKAARTHESAQRNVKPDGRLRSAIVGQSAQMQEIFRIIDKVADTPSTVLITGESGTGKELIATALHEGSSRRDKPLIRINCGAIPKDLMESELFGYERGAFTGAVTSKPGRFELADTGTLFLDEIGEIPVEMQVKLLRVLQDGEFERVGGIKTTRVDVRLIAATNRDLEQEIEAGRFRKDLYYRLNVVPIRLPPLRERVNDIPMLARHFIEKYNKRLNKKIEGITDEALERMKAYSWPGNIRELENLIERVLLFADGPLIGLEDLKAQIKTPAELPPAAPGGPAAAATTPGATGALAATLSASEPLPQEGGLKDLVRARAAELEKDLIIKALDETGGNVTRAARLLQISRKSLQTKMKEFGLRDEAGEDEPAEPPKK